MKNSTPLIIDLSNNKPEIADLTIIAGENSGDLKKTLNQIWSDVQEPRKPRHLIGSDRQLPFILNFKLLDLILATASITPVILPVAGCNLMQSTQDNIEFVKNLDLLSHNQSYIATEYPEIIKQLNHLMGGNLSYNKHTAVIFHKNNRDGSIKDMPIYLSSSVVLNLAYIYFYLQHQIKPGEILLIEEPELSLHPEQQMQMAHILAMLVNAGVRVVITTHSDYMIREFNSLVALNSVEKSKFATEKSKHQALQGINDDMMLDANKINLYGISNGKLSKKLIVDQFGLDLYTFDNATRQQNELFNATDFLIS